MAVSSQKFLPSGKSGSLAVMPAAKLSMIRKPLITTSSDSDAKKTVFDIRNKVTSLTFIFRSKKILKKRILDRKRKLVETEKNKKREERLESKKKATNKDNEKLLITPPGGNIMDSLTRFAGFTLLGFIVDKYSSIFPKLIEFGNFIQPAVEIFGSFAENLVGNTINFIETGYKAYDTVNDIVKKIGGEDYEKIFGNFSKAFNLFLQASLLTGIAGFGGGLVKKPKVVEETIKSGKSILSGDTGISQLRKNEIFKEALRNREFTKERRRAIRSIASRSAVRKSQKKQQLQGANRERLERDRIRTAKRKVSGERKVVPTLPTEPGQIIGAKTKRKYPNTIRQSELMFTTLSGGYKVDFGLPGQPTKRLSPEVAEGIRYMFENPKDRYTKQIAYEAFKYPDLYETDIKANYRDYRKSLFDKSKMKAPTGKSAGAATAAKQIGKQAAKQSAKGFARVIPFIGPLIDIAISLIAGDPLDEAVVGAAGAALGGLVGGALVGSGTFGLGAVIGAGIGSFVGDIFARSLYQAAKGFVFKPKAYATGGQVTRGGKARGAVSRDIKKVGIGDIKSKRIQTVAPQQTAVGKNAYLGEYKNSKGEMVSNYEKIYGKLGLKALKDSSRDVKKIKFMQNIWGALGGAYIDMLLGQTPDEGLASSIGAIIGSMTNETYGRKVGQELSISLENSANNIFRHLYAAVGVERPAMDTTTGQRQPKVDGAQADVKGIDAKGEVIGYVGSTGRSEGPHIHIETGMGYGGAGGAIPASVLKNIIVGGKPLSEWPLTSGVGMREGGMHRGLDYGIPSGTPITLSGGLKFVEYAAGDNAGYGNLVIVSDGAGKKYLLGHLSGGPPNPEVLKKKEPVAPVSQSPQASIAPNQKDVKVSSKGLDGRASYELAIHERNVFLYQQETVLA